MDIPAVSLPNLIQALARIDLAEIGCSNYNIIQGRITAGVDCRLAHLDDSNNQEGNMK